MEWPESVPDDEAMVWPNNLDHKDMLLFMKEATLAGISPLLVSATRGLIKPSLGKKWEKDELETLIGYSFSTIEFWEGYEFCRRYWFHPEKKVWTWTRRPWA
jgi:hypothetical protein